MIRRPWYAVLMVLALLCANLHMYQHLTDAEGDHYVASDKACVLASVTATPAVAPCLALPTELLPPLSAPRLEQIRIAQRQTFRTPRAPPFV
jgi:hypothetical protein